jgi:tetratricopeptide (TPR) repeat protein
MLDRALRRAPIDSIPYLDRDYGAYLAVAAMAGDTARAREWYAEDLRSWEQFGKSFDRPGWEAMSAAMLAVSRGRYSEAKAALDAAERAKLWRTDILSSWRFYVLDRLQETDSALAVGEAYLTLSEPGRVGQDAFFLASTRQRLGEMYEAKGNVDKALEHYTAFVELWKNADPELQPRVRDVRGRIERLQRRRG